LDNTISVIGMAAAACTTISFVPQVIHILKSKDTAGISITMYSIFTFGVLLWVIYGFAIGDMPVLAANLATLILTLCVLTLTLTRRFGADSTPKTKTASGE
jgi:MtN3 and saliva related transmembrane protein